MRDLAMALLGALVALALLAFLHGALQPIWAVGVSLVGAVGLRRAFGGTYADLPAFLELPIDASVALFGVNVAALATVFTRPTLYWVSHWRAPVSLAMGAAVLGVGLATVVYTHRRLQLEITKQEARLAELRTTAVQAQLGALQAQVNPHFLFNSLNTLAELVHEDAGLAEDLIGDLAHMMRYALRSTTGDVSLGQEIEMVERYLRLERARLGDRLQVSLEVADEAREVRVPGLILQPLIENAVKYGVSARKEGGVVGVVVRVVDGLVEIDISDDGPGLPEAVQDRLAGPATALEPVGTGGAGGGLANVQRRLQLAFGQTPLTVVPGPNGTALRLRIPR